MPPSAPSFQPDWARTRKVPTSGIFRDRIGIITREYWRVSLTLRRLFDQGPEFLLAPDLGPLFPRRQAILPTFHSPLCAA
jgi:hypothetical protein